MKNYIDASGINTQSLPEIIADLEEAYKEIYGNDIVLTSNSPDGQFINILAQQIIDQLNLATDIYNNVDPDSAQGAVLDQRVVFQGIQRQSGTFSLQSIDITVSDAVNLEGLDALANDINGTGYTVADNAGTQFILLDSVSLPSAGTYPLTFRAQELGAVTSTPNTITNPITLVNEVIAINNPTGVLELGINEETDASLRLRRQKSFGISALGWTDGLTAALLNIDGVTDARVEENRTNITVNTIPPHSIWAIVEGGSNEDIAQAIYSRINNGAGMKGSVSVDITKINGDIFPVLFDRPLSQTLYIQFSIQRTVTGAIFNETSIKDYIVSNLLYGIGEFAETSKITEIALDAINASGGGGVPVEVLISDDDISYVEYLEPQSVQRKFIIDSLNINITILP